MRRWYRRLCDLQKSAASGILNFRTCMNGTCKKSYCFLEFIDHTEDEFNPMLGEPILVDGEKR